MPGFAKGLFIHPTVPMPRDCLGIVHKKSGEICLCVDYRKLNSITIRDAFPLPHIDEALQMVHSSNVFTSFDLVQRYVQLTMAEDYMPLGMSNAGSSFCRLMEQCLGD